MDYKIPVFVREERLSALEYLQLMQENSRVVRDARVVPPKFGHIEDDFGHFVVQYHTPQKRMRRLPNFEDAAGLYA